MAEKAKMGKEMKQAWGTEIIKSIYETVSGKGPEEEQARIKASESEYNPRTPNPGRAAGIKKGAGY
jgi:hypothetical protein